MQQLAMLSRKAKTESEKERLQKEAESRAADAARLSSQADDAERTRGTTTLANSLAAKARVEIRLADDAQRKIAQLEGGDVLTENGEVGRVRPLLTYEAVTASLKGVRLIPVTGTRTDILRCTDQLDALKAAGSLNIWNSGDSELSAAGFRGGSSIRQLRAATKMPDDKSADIPLGLSSYKALQGRKKIKKKKKKRRLSSICCRGWDVLCN